MVFLVTTARRAAADLRIARMRSAGTAYSKDGSGIISGSTRSSLVALVTLTPESAHPRGLFNWKASHSVEHIGILFPWYRQSDRSVMLPIFSAR